MTNERKQFIYKADEIFEDIPDDPENVNMKIPEDVAKEIGLVPGDNVKVLWGDHGTVIIQKVDKKDTSGEEQ